MTERASLMSTVFTSFGEGQLLRVRGDGINICKFDWGVVYLAPECIEARRDMSDNEEEDELSDFSEDDDVPAINYTGDYSKDKAAITALLKPVAVADIPATKNEVAVNALPPPEAAPELSEDAVLVPTGTIQSIVECMVVIQVHLHSSFAPFNSFWFAYSRVILIHHGRGKREKHSKLERPSTFPHGYSKRTLFAGYSKQHINDSTTSLVNRCLRWTQAGPGHDRGHFRGGGRAAVHGAVCIQGGHGRRG